ncbi:MAG: ABC transporter ATP-binding protein [Deltaproteobacteria bacterium]|nr:ABC transporter ATP-binding protein [Deltaproteobacteria bacterium]MBW2121354.1 ABC transporter ATP-binding protein [Deltaproteobacteria bacterium]
MLLSVKNLEKSFGGLRALDGVSLEVEEDTVTGLIGPNGSGKTTLFNVVSGFLPKDGGEVWFRGRRIDELSPDRIARLGLVRTFQIDRSAVEMTVLENLLVAAPEQHGEALWRIIPDFRRILREEKENLKKAVSILDLIGLKHLANEYAGNLSGGQRKLLSLGRMLMAEPALYLLDEPTAGVNPTLIRSLLAFLRKEVISRRGRTIFIIEHNMKVISSICDKVIVLDSGTKIAEGTPREVQNNERVLACYLARRRREDQDDHGDEPA